MIPYGLLVLVSGIIGYARRGSTASLARGASSGVVLLLTGFLGLKAFEKRRNSYVALVLETLPFVAAKLHQQKSHELNQPMLVQNLLTV
ncbi:protein FATTY ACID EXPORT 5 [Canna indica]|uniref:Protein FATTY ACID EXPORT 5 n=1 Tax=Canna indica TaxID=4628 RepID=A0AAQ3JXE7_9LILI|nr:protein FATTY ACID EXPORT 5 [Canna indica]